MEGREGYGEASGSVRDSRHRLRACQWLYRWRLLEIERSQNGRAQPMTNDIASMCYYFALYLQLISMSRARAKPSNNTPEDSPERGS